MPSFAGDKTVIGATFETPRYPLVHMVVILII